MDQRKRMPAAQYLTAAEMQKFGIYQIIRELGRGGMGRVYLVRHPQRQRPLALKILLDEECTRIRRFQREAELLARLSHENIVRIYEMNFAGTTPYIVMDYIDGCPLSKYIDNTNLSFQQRAEIIAIIAEALHYAHEHGILHRDIKPSNILIDKTGKPYLLDFGLARANKVHDKTLTKTGEVIGTPKYMSPEQTRGDWKRLDRRSDVYSLGAVLYETLTGTPVVTSSNMIAMLYQVINQEPSRVRQLVPEIPLQLDEICYKSLSKSPKKRYATMQDFAHDLRCSIQGNPELLVRGEKKRAILRIGAFFTIISIMIAIAIYYTFTHQTIQPQKSQESYYKASDENYAKRAQAYKQLVAEYCREAKDWPKNRDKLKKVEDLLDSMEKTPIALRRILHADLSALYHEYGNYCQNVTKEYQRAEKYYQKALQFTPGHPPTHAQLLGLYYFHLPRQKPLTEILEHFTSAQTVDEAYWYRAQIYQDLMVKQKALQYYQKARSDYRKVLLTDKFPTYKNLRSLYLQAGKLFPKKVSYDDGIKESQGREKSIWLYARANFSFSRGNYKAALDDIQILAQQQWLHDAAFYELRGMVLKKLGHKDRVKRQEYFRRAKDDLSQAIAMNPNIARIYWHLGIACEYLEPTPEESAKSLHQKVENNYTKAIDLAAANNEAMLPHIYYRRATFNLHRHEFAKSKKDFEILYKRWPSPAVCENYGRWYMWQQSFAQAIEKFSQGIELGKVQLQDKKNLRDVLRTCYRNRYVCFRLLGKEQKANEDMKKAAKFGDPWINVLKTRNTAQLLDMIRVISKK